MPTPPMEATQLKQLEQLDHIATAIDRTNRLLLALLTPEQIKSFQEAETTRCVNSLGQPRRPK